MDNCDETQQEYRLHTCYHCGNQGLMKIEHIHKNRFGDYIEDPYGNVIGIEFEENFRWTMLSCPVCGMVTLVEDYDNSAFEEVTSVLYPETKIDSAGVPKSVQEAFEAALKVKNISNEICALSLRRVLEAICKDKGASGHNLNSMVKDMIERKILPEMFDDACWIIRELGNNAAHADDAHFSKHQVDETIGFVQNIINYLYTLPVKMKEMRSAVEADKAAKKEKKENG